MRGKKFLENYVIRTSDHNIVLREISDKFTNQISTNHVIM